MKMRDKRKRKKEQNRPRKAIKRWGGGRGRVREFKRERDEPRK